VNRPVIARNVREHLPYMATENLMMAAVQAGEDRQVVHEVVRQHSHAVIARVKAGEGSPTELFDRLKAAEEFRRVDFGAVTDPRLFVGRSPQQVDEFVAEHVEPIRARYAGALGGTADLHV
jgi:adenylosuccinate lyase